MRTRLSVIFVIVLAFSFSSVSAAPEISGSLQTTLAFETTDPLLLSGGHQLELNLAQYFENTGYHLRLNGKASYPFSLSLADEPFTVEVDEGYIDYFAKDYDLRLGKQRISWGTALEINPTDIINPIDPKDPMGDKQAILAGQFDYFIGSNLKLTGVWVPFFQPALLSVRHPVTNEAITAELSQPSLTQSEFAVKISALGLHGVDLSGSYFRGHEDVPYVLVEEDGISAVFREINSYGADLATTLGDFGFWIEGAHIVPDRGDSYNHWIIGSDYSFANGLVLVGQYYRRNDDRGNWNYLIIGAEKSFRSIHSGRLGLVYNLDSNSYMLSPEIKLSLGNAANLTIGMTNFEVNEGGLGLPLLDEQSQVYIQISANF